MANKVKKAAATEDFVLEEWLNSLTNDGVRVRVLKETDDGRLELIDSKKLSLITDEYLLKLKAGTYKLQVCRQNGQVVATRSMHIGERPDAEDILPVSTGNDFNDRLFLMMQSEQKRSHEMILALIAGMFQAKSGSGDSPAALLNAMTGAMANMKNLAGVEKDPLDTVDKVLSIADRIGGNAAPKTTTDRLMEMAGQLLPGLLAGGGASPRQLNPAVETSREETPVPALPAPAQGTSAVERPNGAALSTAELKTDIGKLWGKLVAGAESDYDVDAAGSMILDLEQLGDPAAAVIVESIVRAKSFEEWKTTINLDSKYHTWLNRFFMAVLKMTAEPQKVEEVATT